MSNNLKGEIKSPSSIFIPDIKFGYDYSDEYFENASGKTDKRKIKIPTFEYIYPEIKKAISLKNVWEGQVVADSKDIASARINKFLAYYNLSIDSKRSKEIRIVKKLGNISFVPPVNHRIKEISGNKLYKFKVHTKKFGKRVDMSKNINYLALEVKTSKQNNAKAYTRAVLRYNYFTPIFKGFQRTDKGWIAYFTLTSIPRGSRKFSQAETERKIINARVLKGDRFSKQLVRVSNTISPQIYATTQKQRKVASKVFGTSFSTYSKTNIRARRFYASRKSKVGMVEVSKKENMSTASKRLQFFKKYINNLLYNRNKKSEDLVVNNDWIKKLSPDNNTHVKAIEKKYNKVVANSFFMGTGKFDYYVIQYYYYSD